ncbi:MAG: CRTAC1 family protein [Gemmatimonadota bacterium]|uniref:CRTAC1 family protein n=1 Tax=Candidatus Palauibacter scopulicola TaxID=3056741 RepID=UPI0023852436|nr:CRTAC1 family protein [Candidatus Palauibacter scopulicola]MDE2662251.1 CRTAC1 family protein [Candidatus Palauibacter scopulicola]
MNARRAGPLSIGLLAAATACGPDESEDAEAPSYTQTRPSFTAREGSDATTSIRFTDVTAAARIDFVHATGAFGEKWMPETMGSGVVVLDYDGDGWPDLFFVNSTGWEGRAEDRGARSMLLRNLGDGTFRDVTREAGLDRPLYGMGGAAADYDADGDTDLYVTAVGDNRLYRNDGGRFTDVTSETGTAGNAPDATDPAWSTASAWFDADGDGWLDLLVCNYVDWTPETDLFFTRDGVNKSYATPEEYNGESCRLLRNEPASAGVGGSSVPGAAARTSARRFRDVTAESGLENPEGKSLGIVIDDFTGNGLPDVAIANDTYQNFLYRNEGDGTFADVALDAGVAFDEFGRARAGMGVDVGDILNRGQLSIAIGNFSNEPVSLFTQIQAGLFQDLAGSARLTRSTLLPLTFGLRFADFDLDRYVDLVLGNGHIEPEIEAIQGDVTFAQPPQLFRNDGRGGFIDAGAMAGGGFDEPIVARGVATFDYDRDGDLDLVISTNGGAAKLFRNDLEPGPGWVRLRLEGAAPNLGAVGATVRVFVGDVAQRFVVSTASSYLSQSEANPVLAGLGGAPRADSVVVVWPGGARTVTGPVEAGAALTIRE